MKIEQISSVKNDGHQSLMKFKWMFKAQFFISSKNINTLNFLHLQALTLF